MDHPPSGGLKGATGSGKTADVSTAVVSEANDEERSEALDRSLSGLSESLTQSVDRSKRTYSVSRP